MRSNNVNIGDSILASQYNNLRKDAYGGSMLLAHEQSTPNLTLYVEPGVCYVGNTRVVFAGGNSPAFTAPTTNPRIDLLTIDSAGVLGRVIGTEATSPTPPAYPNDKLVLCEVYNRVGQTAIRDTDTSGQGYIYNDVRPFLGGAYIASAAQIADGIITDAKLESAFVHTSGNETINGIKTFNSIPVLPASNPTTDNQAARKAYVDSKGAPTMVVSTIFEKTGRFVESISGGSITYGTYGVAVDTGGTTVNNYAKLQLSAGVGGVFDKLVKLTILIDKYYAGSSNNITNSFIGVGDWGLNSPNTIKHIGFRFVVTGAAGSGTRVVYASNGNGSANTQTDITTAWNNAAGGIARIVKDGTNSIKFYRGTTLLATHTTNIPTGDANYAITIHSEADSFWGGSFSDSIACRGITLEFKDE